MGAKYTTNATSGYNATPPADDGTVSEANKVKWSTIKTKLTDTLKTFAEAIDTDLVAHFNNGPTAITSNTTLGASHYNQIIQVSGAAVTLTLSDAATLAAGWFCRIVNTDSSNNVTIGRATAGDTINGSAANFTLTALHAIDVFVIAAATGFQVRSAVINPATTDTAQTLTSKTLSSATLSGTTTNSGTISGGTMSGATLSGTTTNSGTISGGTISGITDLAVADGGTGASTAAGARTNIGAGVVDVLNRDVSIVDLVSSTTESTLYTFSVPGGTLSTDRALRLTLIGDYLKNDVNSLTIRIKYGATTVLSSVLSDGEITSDASRRAIMVDFVLSAANATNAQVGSIRVSVGAANTIAGSAAAVALTEVGASTAVAEDSTGALNLVVTGQHSASTANASFRVHVVQLEYL